MAIGGGPFGIGLCLILDGVALPQTNTMFNLGVLLDSQLPLKKQMAVVAKRTFAQLWVVNQLFPFPDWNTLLSITYAFVISIRTSTIYSTWGYIWRVARNYSCAEDSDVSSFGHPQGCASNTYYMNCIGYQFASGWTFKVLYGMGTGYQRNHLVHISLIHPIWSGRRLCCV